jgi:hypothetical protein
MLVGDLQVLRVLNLSRCSGLVGLSVLVGKIKVLRVLNLSRCPGVGRGTKGALEEVFGEGVVKDIQVSHSHAVSGVPNVDTCYC